MRLRHHERHRTDRVGWLRAAVLGANDGIVSTASLVLGVAAAGDGGHRGILLAGTAGLVAGAMSMATGEYVSVHSQADTERADIEREKRELATDAAGERRELTAIYIGRGLDPDLARKVADQLTAHDALGAHTRDELGISQNLAARPVQAALASASSFATGAALPLLVVAFTPLDLLPVLVPGASLLCLALLGAGDMLSVYVRQSLIQIYTPNEMRGRVGAVATLFVSGSNELGEAESGLIASLIGPVPAVVVGGIGAIGITILWAGLFPELPRARTFDPPKTLEDVPGEEMAA